MNSTNSADIPLSNSGTSQEDRRHHERYTVEVQIEIHSEGSETPLRLATTDISRGGCYVRVMDQFALGVRVRATLWLDGYPIVVDGLVVTRHPQFGNGIMFMNFEGDGERLLGRYVDAIAASA
jgi:PilZ domain